MNRTATTGSALGSLLFLSIVIRALFPELAAPLAMRVAATAPAPVPVHDNTDDSTDGPWNASQQFFAGRQPACPTESTSGPARWCIPPDAHVLALVAIAPDPVRSHMALTFDRTVDGIQLAAQSQGFVVDRYWLPWKAPSAPSESGGSSAGTTKAAEPGLLLFRESGKPTTSLLFVFLVADTSTAGIDGTQFSNAVRYVDQVTGLSDAPVHVVGPSFSGSLASLRRLTDLWNGRTFIVSSGSVSSLCAMAEQGLVATWPTEPCGPPPPNWASIGDVVRFRTFVHDTESAVDKLVRTFYPEPSKQCTQPQVAILSEATTRFGTVARQKSDGTATDPEKSPCIASFAFPREIASLRNASRPAAVPAKGSSESANAASSPFLPLDLADRTNSSDAPPDYSSMQGPLSKEAVLMNIAAGFRRARYRHIGIISSNVLDTLFLTDFLRAVCPDSRLFMMSGDLLFERQFDNVPYVGMLTATTYPLIDRPLVPVVQSDRALGLPFSDEYERGEFEATGWTIQQLLNPQATPAPPPDSSSLWMMVVGVGGYWPVRLLDPTPAPDVPGFDTIVFTGGWQLLVILFITVGLFHVAVLLTASPFAQQFRDFAAVAAAPVQRLFFVQVSCATLALGLAWLLMPAWRYAQSPSVLEVVGSAVLAAVIAAACLVEATTCLRCRWTTLVDRTSSTEGWWTVGFTLLAFAVVWILSAIAAYQWWQIIGRRESLYGFFFAYRVMNPTSGVSPITPMIPLLATLYAWTFFEIWRLRFNETLRPRLFRSPDDAAVHVARRNAAEQPRPGLRFEAAIAGAIQRYWLRGSYVAVFVAAFVVWLTSFHPSNPFVLFETGWFGALYGVLFCLVVALMLSAGCRVAQMWSALHGLLGELERSRVRLTFVRLKDRSWSFWRQGGEDTEWAYMARSLEAVDRLGTGDAAAVPSSRKDQSPPEENVVECLRTSKEQLDRAMDSGAPDSDVALKFDALAERITTVDALLARANPRPFLQSAVGDAKAALETCRSIGPVAPSVLQEARRTFSARVGGLLTAIGMSTASAAVKDSVREVRKQILQLRATQPRVAALRSCVGYARALRRGATGTSPDGQAGVSGIEQARTLEAGIRHLQESLADALWWALEGLENRWSSQVRSLTDGEEPPSGDAKSQPTPDGRQQQCLEEFVALRYVAFIRGALSHVRHAMIFLALSFSMVLISLNIYSFEPHRSLIWSFTAIFVVTGIMIVAVLMQLHRDPIMSRITNTTGNSLDLHFYLRIVAFGAVPLFTLLATNFPSVGRYLVSFVGPSLEALK